MNKNYVQKCNRKMKDDVEAEMKNVQSDFLDGAHRTDNLEQEMKRVQDYLASLNNKLITKDSVEKVMEKHINTFSGIVAKKMKSDKDQIREVL